MFEFLTEITKEWTPFWKGAFLFFAGIGTIRICDAMWHGIDVVVHGWPPPGTPSVEEMIEGKNDSK